MEVKIEVSDEQFQKIVKESIESLPQEKLHEVVLNAFKEYLLSNDVVKNLFTEKDGYYSNTLKPTRFLQDLMAKADTTAAVNEIRDDMLLDLKKNHREIIEQAFMKVFLRSIFETNEFNQMAYIAADGILSGHLATNHQNQ